MVKEGGGYRNTPAKSSPYNVSNSFVKRIASRVSGLFSQSPINSEDDKTETTIRNTSMSEQNHIISPISEDTLQILKRRRLHSLEDTQAITHNRDGGNERSFSATPDVDIGRPGPSGYQRTHNMVSSTPAVMLTGLKLIRDNIAKQSTSRDIEAFKDACSESNASTSGYTPLAPQSNRSSQFRRVTASSSGGTSEIIQCEVDVHRRSMISDSDSQSQSQLPANNLNSSNISNRNDSIHITSLNKHEPSFNPSIVSASNTRKQLSSSLTSLSSSSLSIGNNAHNRSLTTQSPFYCNRTMYGGAATFSRSKNSNISNKTNLFSLPKKMNVKPISNKPETTSTDTNTGMSAAARRILETINSYSSPIMDARRIPVNEPSSSGSTHTNKRKRTALTASLDETVPSMPDLLTIKRREMMNKSTCEARSATLNATKSTSSNTVRYSPADLSDISSDETDDEIQPPARINKVDNRTHITKITRRRGKTDFDDRPVEDVDLPNVVLEIKELPNFSSNTSSKNRTIPKNMSDNFSFARPLMESATDVGNLIKNKNNNNLCDLMKSKRNEVPNTETLDRQVKSNDKSGFVAAVPSKSKWKCEECWVMNDGTESKCIACGGGKIKTNPTVKETWKCDTCWVMNEKTDANCKACTASKEPTVSKPVVVKASVEKWKCAECWITNEKEQVKCVACGTIKPGAVEKKESPFSFGISQPKTEKKEQPNFNFGIPSTSTSQEKSSFSKIVPSEFKFGINNSVVPEVGNSSEFKFGNDTSENSSKSANTIKGDKVDNQSTTVNEINETKSNESGFKFGFDSKLKETNSENSLLKSNQNSKTKETSEMFKFGSNSATKFPALTNPPLTFGLNSLAKDTNSDSSSLTKFGTNTELKDTNLKNSSLEINSNGPETIPSNSVFKFGGNSTTNESNTNSPMFKFGSNFGSKETSADTSLFKFGSNSSTGGFTFRKAEEDKKSTTFDSTPPKTLDMFKPRLNDFGSNSHETTKTPSLGMKRPKSPSPVPAKKKLSITEEPKVNGDLKEAADTGMETVSPKWSTNNSLFPVRTESNTNMFGSFQQPPSGRGGGFTFKPTTQPFTFGSATTMPTFNFGPSCSFQDTKPPLTNMFNTAPATGTSFASPFGNNTNSTTVDGPLKQGSNDQSNKPVFPALNQPTFGASSNTNFSQPQTGFNPVLPMSFNFSTGTAPRAFTAQPIPTVGTHTAPPGIAQRRFRKAVRRSQMK